MHGVNTVILHGVNMVICSNHGGLVSLLTLDAHNLIVALASCFDAVAASEPFMVSEVFLGAAGCNSVPFGRLTH